MRQKGVFSTDMTESFESALAKTRREVFLEGVHDGMPIALGYFVVSFTLGIAARNAGLDPLQGFLASFFNNASAGEYAGFTVIEANAPCSRDRPHHARRQRARSPHRRALVAEVPARHLDLASHLRRLRRDRRDLRHHDRAQALNPMHLRRCGARTAGLGRRHVARRRRRQHPAACRRQRPLRRALRHVPLGHHPASQEEPHRRRPRARELCTQLPRLHPSGDCLMFLRHAHDHPDCPDRGHRRRTLPHPRTTGTRRLPGRR